VGFCIISVYVDDLNIKGNKLDIDEARHHLTTKFEMKDLGKTKFCLGRQLEHLPSGILVHQSTYTQKVFGKIQYEYVLSFKDSYGGQIVGFRERSIQTKG
jgi:hypothetical protein